MAGQDDAQGVPLSILTLMPMCGRRLGLCRRTLVATGITQDTAPRPSNRRCRDRASECAERSHESDGRFVPGRGLMMADPCHKTVEPERERRDGTRRAESGELVRVDEQRQNR